MLFEESNLIIDADHRNYRDNNATGPDQLPTPCSANRKTYPGTKRDSHGHYPSTKIVDYSL